MGDKDIGFESNGTREHIPNLEVVILDGHHFIQQERAQEVSTKSFPLQVFRTLSRIIYLKLIVSPMWTGMRFTHFLDLITTIVKWTAMSKLHFRLHKDCIKDASAEMGFNNILGRCFHHQSIAMHIYMAVNFYFPTRSSLLKMNVLCLCISIINENWVNIPVVSVHFLNLQNNKIIVDGSYNEEYKGSTEDSTNKSHRWEGEKWWRNKMSVGLSGLL